MFLARDTSVTLSICWALFIHGNMELMPDNAFLLPVLCDFYSMSMI